MESLNSQNSATTTVIVKITDVNEFAPEFTSPLGICDINNEISLVLSSYTVLGNPSYIVSEGETVLPKTIVTATATDDDGTNNIPTFAITTPVSVYYQKSMKKKKTRRVLCSFFHGLLA